MFSNMRYIYKIYKEGSFSKAAKDLYISQPSLSATLKKVEQKIGMPLFERSTNPIQLTECGKQYIKTAEQLINFWKRTIVMNQVLFMNMRVMMVEFYQKKLHIVMILMNSTKTLSEERKCLILI